MDKGSGRKLKGREEKQQGNFPQKIEWEEKERESRFDWSGGVPEMTTLEDY
jgi:hypothetical protein